MTQINERMRRRDKDAVTYAIAQEATNSIAQTLANLKCNRNGLTQDDADERLEQFGANQVAHDKAPHALIQLIKAFNNPFIFVLMVLAAISFFTDYWLPLQSGEETELTGVIIILTMVTLSGLLRFWQEYRTNKAAEALKSMVRTTATVLRRSSYSAHPLTLEVPIRELVPGDIIQLSAGDMVPADVRLIASRDLFISQAILTGEAIPIEKYDAMGNVAQKSSEGEVSSENALLELSNICLMGTNVASGTATAVVVATGGRTYFGSLAKSIVGSRAQTAFDRGVNSVSWLLIRFMLVMVPVVLLINGFTKGDWSEAALFALAVAVGLTPEMLPMIVSSNLAKGAIAMSRRKVVVKRLNAIQNFGAMDVLCTDKTGTLTQDKIVLERHTDAFGAGSERVLRYAWLNSFYQTGLKNLLDVAVLSCAEQNRQPEALQNYRKVDEIPFDFVRRRMSVVVAKDNEYHELVCKGALEEMLAICSHVRHEDEVIPLSEALLARIRRITDDLNQQGLRVVAVANKILPAQTHEYGVADESDLILEGYVAFLDPPKESTAPALAALKQNGVTVKILTGDNELVAAKVCRDVGLEADHLLRGSEIEQMDDEQLAQAAARTTVFAKLTPLHKERIVKLLRRQGHVVGFMGDGINDAPALRAADIGISVDSAVDIAKEAADIILLEKSLMVLEQGVIEGRRTFANMLKYIKMTASSNFGNVFSVLVASAFIPFLPMLAIHLLIQNLMYDISQLSLPWDKMDKEFLRKPRKWDSKNIGRFMLWIGPTSSIFDITTYALMWYVFAANSVEHQALFQSGWFIEGLLSQTLVVHMLRTQKIPFIQSTAALPVLLTTGLVMALGIYIPFSPLGALVGLQPLPWEYFPWLAATLVSYCVVAQLMKRFYIRRFGEWL
ncbi:magnesium-translocating P-type ATPase [Serratia marcescens]|uniref:magnesium-translocating P-type ATPase n=1 Tax=Serratia marcescens TaxID=615 RepID=UPI000F7F8B03|nr:magnesium-translocating P-type ATPase [Serratia marcescens]RTF31496.1 magnesium-translocating P-type ATPase [Serratia marcescens]RTF49366.1 magnesium-translocating P-type ATPase [Serratia marcescens]RTG39850.1 magnesium-translocating P-type ATPase [Serratia marcescens]RTG58448.1 magnesium-translocating P-type ATPase [Serratia marcescens]RTG72123.1 magnesium-translocating P-type ATPase [Serratia marcescens]